MRRVVKIEIEKGSQPWPWAVFLHDQFGRLECTIGFTRAGALRSARRLERKWAATPRPRETFLVEQDGWPS